MNDPKRRKPRPPLDAERLERLALRYVERFATTRAKLKTYLLRKVRERGWQGADEPAIEAIADRFTHLGYVDDASFAMAKSRSLSARGYGPRRVGETLRAAGVGEQDAEAARRLADQQAADSALRFARRRRLGPFAAELPDPKGRERALAALVRAGHSFALARAIVELEPGSATDVSDLADKAGLASE